TDQVASEAKASPTMTIFTSGTALRNIPQGDKSRGKADGSKASVMRGGGLDSSAGGAAGAPDPAGPAPMAGATSATGGGATGGGATGGGATGGGAPGGCATAAPAA